MRTNNTWASSVASQVSSEAAAASRLCRKSVYLPKLTRKLDGFTCKGMTLTQLRAKYGQGGSMTCRVLRRHGVRQGQKHSKCSQGNLEYQTNGTPVMVDKIRLIDDSKRSLSNSCLMRCCETIAPCRFTYLATVAEELVKQTQALGRRSPPTLVFSTDDMRAA